MADDIAEKRRYFRVNDTINLLYKIIDEKSLDTLSHVSNNVLSNCSLTSAIDVLNQDARGHLARLERRDPELVEFLRILDTKINLIAQVIAAKEEQFSSHDTRDVVLSATGLAFSNETAILPGQLLELRMLLTSCMAVIVAHAKVIHCRTIADESPEYPYQVCVEYINLQEDDRELLIKHVVKKQLQQLRDKNES